jgi:esterase/lipase superfamily enzyme
MNREYHFWWSWRLDRNMELLVFGHAGAKVIVFPTREGRFYEYENLRMTEVFRDKLEKGFLQLFCVDGIDSESFYCREAHPSGRIQRHRQYEEYILNEVLPFMALKNPHPCVIVHGCSLGAYHAVNIAMRHPHLFRKLAAFSGRYDLTINVEGFPGPFRRLLQRRRLFPHADPFSAESHVRPTPSQQRSRTQRRRRLSFRSPAP